MLSRKPRNRITSKKLFNRSANRTKSLNYIALSRRGGVKL